MDEFELIRRFFSRHVTAPGIIAGIGDDGAVLRISPGLEQIQVIDTLVEGVHFPVDSKASDIGYRVVEVNLSDIAAMGARPRWMTLALTIPKTDEHWVADFAGGLFEAASEFDVALVGGDTTSGDAVVATVHITGEVASGSALLRSGAQPGDTIFVSGTFGDAAAGLELLRCGKHDEYLAGRFLRPRARIELGNTLIGKANAAIDVSDGLTGDLKKLLDASGVGAVIEVDRVPLSDELRSQFDTDQCRQFALVGGDDYELCFTAAAERVEGVSDITAIGTVTTGNALVCRLNGGTIEYDDSGYRHFE